jgi:ABC-type antimicrobial peptide transport system permease subunit
MKMRLSRGRWLAESDDSEAPPVVLINEFAARTYWPDEDPLLARVRIAGAWRRVVGVVADTRHFGLDRSDRPAMYFPYAQLALRSMYLVVRTESPPGDFAVPLQRAIAEIDPGMALSDVRPLGDIVSATVATPRVTTGLFAVFALAALALAAIGLYGVLSYTVGLKVREIGIRMALGADRGAVVKMVLRESGALLLVGVVVGALLSLAAARAAGALLFGLSPADPVVLAKAVVALVAVAAFASYVPAERAARIDPMRALRED